MDEVLVAECDQLLKWDAPKRKQTVFSARREGRMCRGAWRRLLWGPVVAAVMLAGACGGDEPTAAESGDRPAEKETEKEAGPAGMGPIEGDPDSIRTFDDPSTEIETASDLIAYMLPGMSGEGVDCTVSAVDVDEVLVNSREDGAWELASLIVDECVTGKTIGYITAMYATALDESEDLPYTYDDIAPCVAREWAESGGANTARLTEVFESRLDLTGPLRSPAIARENIDAGTGCLDDYDDDSDSGSTSLPPTTTTTAAPPSTLPTQTITMFSALAPGMCLLAVPENVAMTVTTIDCTQPHVAEVVAADLGAPKPEGHCPAAETAYSGGRALDWPATIVTWTRDEVAGAVRTVCMIKTSDGRFVAGTIRTG